MNLVINSQFRPFTYDEMVKPLVQYKEAYDKVEQDYSDLAAQTEMWKDIVNQTNSPEAYAMYKDFSDRLNVAVEDFSHGMNLSNRGALLGMKRDYAKSIVPIAMANEAMKSANDFRAKAGADAIFEVTDYNSLDQFLHGKTANNRFLSREAVIKQTAAVTEAAMAEAMRDPEFKQAMGGQYWQIVQHTGGSYKDLMEAMKLGMMDNPLAQNRFSEIRQRMLKDLGVDRFDATGQKYLSDAIDTGMYVGLDKPTTQFQANQAFGMTFSGGGGGGGHRGRGSRGSGGGGYYTISGGGRSRKRSSSEHDTEGAWLANDVILSASNKDYTNPDKWRIWTEGDRVTNEQTGNTWGYDPKVAHGTPLAPHRSLKSGPLGAVQNYLGGNVDVNQYDISYWSAGGRQFIQLRGKQSPVKKGQGANYGVDPNAY